jgi:hypothetical protein
MSAQQSTTTRDPHVQLRALYQALCTNHDHFEEFRTLLALYEVKPAEAEAEPVEAASIRAKLNARITEWLGGEFEGLSAVQAMLWRAILVEERFNVALSPWRESNMY